MNAQTALSAARIISTIGGTPQNVSPLNGFQGGLTPSRLSWTYRAGLAAVTFAMVLLPAMYVALILLAAWGVYWHATQNLWIFSGSSGALVRMIAYAGPIVAGITLVLFMVKPFFARRARRRLTIALKKEEEPLLFEFVDRVCGLVGAPAPAQIEVNCDVNACASFRKGFVSIFGNDLVLTIGLPLVAGLNMRQFAGVLAHEFGHFAQGAGMRLTYIIRQVNGWFARVVYERDEWDIKLAKTARSIDVRIGIVLHMARGAVWVTRKILWVLMHIGHAISCFMLRQMEFDADSYECKLAGSDTFADTTLRIQALTIASQHAFGDLSESWRNGRLPDNFAAFVQHKAAGFSAELRGKIQEEFGRRKTGAFDTHPSDRDRIKAAQALSAPGVFRLEDAAVNLFADFPKLSKAVTREFYEKQHELALTEQSLVSTEESVKEAAESQKLNEAMQRYCFGVNMAVVPLKMAPWQCLALPDWRASLSTLEAARQKVGEMKETVLKAIEKHGEVEQKWISHFDAWSLRRANFTVEAEHFGVASTHMPELETAMDVLAKELAQIESTIQPFMEVTAGRIAAAFQLLNHQAVALESLHPLRAEGAALIEVLSGLSDVLGNLHQIRREFPGLQLLLQNRANHHEPAKVDAVLGPMAEAFQRNLGAIHARLKEVPYPFVHASGRITVSQYARGRGNYEYAVEEAYFEGQAATDRLYTLYYKVAGKIASIAELVEERVTEIAAKTSAEGQ
jgi:Zn-dependent protease with chaperone function